MDPVQAHVGGNRHGGADGYRLGGGAERADRGKHHGRGWDAQTLIAHHGPPARDSLLPVDCNKWATSKIHYESMLRTFCEPLAVRDFDTDHSERESWSIRFTVRLRPTAQA